MAADLAGSARERAMLATVADAIITAAAGKGLRVAVACPDTQVAFAGHLTRALHARGRACRCLAPKPRPAETTLASCDHEAGAPTVMLITSGTSNPSEVEVCRVSICVTTEAPMTPRSVQARGGHWDSDREPDIVVDYHDPSGPKIRHIAPALALR